MIKSSAGRLSNEGSADSNDITDDTNNFSTEMTQKHSNRKCRRNRIQRLTNNEERRWTSAAKNLSHHRSYQNPHSRATQTAVERVRNFHSAARLIAQNFTNFTTSQHTSGQPHSFTHSVPIEKKFYNFPSHLRSSRTMDSVNNDDQDAYQLDGNQLFYKTITILERLTDISESDPRHLGHFQKLRVSERVPAAACPSEIDRKVIEI